MSFNALPAISLSWDASSLAQADFLRYEVWRRITGATDYTKIARLNSTGSNSFVDYRVTSGVQYDYAVTQVKSVGGDEVSSALPTAAQATITVRSLFIHDVSSPSFYAEVLAQQRVLSPDQDINFVQPRGASDPVAHVGHTLTRTFDFTASGSWWDAKSGRNTDMWDALVTLQQRQRDNGSTLLMRTGTGIYAYCVITKLQRSDTPTGFSVKLSLQRTKFDDSVD